jgi:hypothetical protein
VKEHRFTLRFDLSAVGEDPDQCVELLAEHGCDDATIGIGVPGRLALAFSREASSAEDAVTSAVRDVRAALPAAVLVEATPDFVGITEVAAIVGKSRQNVLKLLQTCKTAGPTPIHEGRSSIWHLAPVLVWLRDEKRYRIEDDLLDLATTNMQLNAVATQLRMEPHIKQGIKSLLA